MSPTSCTGHKAMLPGDYIALVFNRRIVTTDTGLSEGIFWDYQEKKFPKNFSGIMALRRRCWHTKACIFCAGKFEKGNCN